MRTRLLLLSALFLLTSTKLAWGQSADSSLYVTALNYAIEVHDDKLKDQLPILNGSVFVDYPYNFSIGSPFFLSGHFEEGSVLYDDTYYAGLPLIYDQLAGELIAGLKLNIRLVPEKVNSFSIAGHRFVRISQNILTTPAGFYEWMSAGKLNLYKKAIKKLILQRQKLSSQVAAVVEETDLYFLEQAGHVFPVNNKNQLFARLGADSEQILQFVRKNDLVLSGSNYEYGLIKVIAYYNGINR